MKWAQQIVMEKPRRVLRPAGRLFVVTGGGSGIGGAATRSLLRAGARVVVGARDPRRAEETRLALADAAPPSHLEVLVCDLTSPRSVAEFADRVSERHPEVHGLLNCAGLRLGERRVGPEGFEEMFAAEVLGHFLLTNLLLDALRAGAPSRVVTVASEEHTGGPKAPARLDPENLQAERSFHPLAHAKHLALARLLFSRELGRRLAGTGVTSVAVSPGPTRTGLLRHLPPFQRLLAEVRLLMHRAPSAEAAGPHLLEAVVDPDLEGSVGRYLVQGREQVPGPAARDPAAGQKLWEVTEEVLGRRFPVGEQATPRTDEPTPPAEDATSHAEEGAPHAEEVTPRQEEGAPHAEERRRGAGEEAGSEDEPA